jgi:hypothetical protein
MEILFDFQYVRTEAAIKKYIKNNNLGSLGFGKSNRRQEHF